MTTEQALATLHYQPLTLQPPSEGDPIATFAEAAEMAPVVVAGYCETIGRFCPDSDPGKVLQLVNHISNLTGRNLHTTLADIARLSALTQSAESALSADHP